MLFGENRVLWQVRGEVHFGLLRVAVTTLNALDDALGMGSETSGTSPFWTRFSSDSAIIFNRQHVYNSIYLLEAMIMVQLNLF